MCFPIVQVRAAMPGMGSCSFANFPPLTYLVCFLRILCMSTSNRHAVLCIGMPVSEQNCHPFQWGRYLFMHNGECLPLLFID